MKPTKNLSELIAVVLCGLMLFGFLRVNAINYAAEEEALHQEQKEWESIGATIDNPWKINPIHTDTHPSENDGTICYSGKNGDENIIGAHRGTDNGDKIASQPEYVLIDEKLYKFSETLTSAFGGESLYWEGFSKNGKLLITCYSQLEEGYEDGLMHVFGYLPVE